MRVRNALLVLVIAGLFGSSFTWMRVAVPEFGPAVLAEARVVIAALVLVLFVGRRGLAALAADWRGHLLLGLFGAALPFVLIGAAEQWITASLATVLNASVPLMTTVGSAVWLGEPLSRRSAVGIGAGITGVAMITGLPLGDQGMQALWGSVAVLAAALSYSVALVYTRRAFASADPLQTAIGQLVCASVLLAPAAIARIPLSPPTLPAELSVLMIAIPGTAVAWPLLFRVVAQSGPLAASTVTLVAPAFGLLTATLVLGENVETRAIPGVVMISLALLLIVSGTSAEQGKHPIALSPSRIRFRHVAK